MAPKDGSIITVRLSGRGVRDEREGTEVFEVIAEDVTERKALEDQLRQAQKMEAVGKLAGGVAHDFNNLLTVITGYSQILMDQNSKNAQASHSIEQIFKAADRATSLTRQLLAFSRRQMLQPRLVSLNALVRNLEKMLRPLLGERIQIVVRSSSDLGGVRADPSQLDHILMNLAVNARDAMPRGGTLTVATANADLGDAFTRTHPGATPGQYVMLLVSDTGTGMNEHTLTHLFEPFFTTKEPGKGTGLGLSMVYGFVKQSGGYTPWIASWARERFSRSTCRGSTASRSLRQSKRSRYARGRIGNHSSGRRRRCGSQPGRNDFDGRWVQDSGRKFAGAGCGDLRSFLRRHRRVAHRRRHAGNERTRIGREITCASSRLESHLHVRLCRRTPRRRRSQRRRRFPSSEALPRPPPSRKRSDKH